MHESYLLATATRAAASVPSPEGIGFRPEGDGFFGQILGVLLITAAVLALFLGLALFARSRGWLARWQVRGHPGHADASELPIRIEQALRLSPRTTTFYLKVDGRSWLVVESTANVQLAPAVSMEDGDD